MLRITPSVIVKDITNCVSPLLVVSGILQEAMSDTLNKEKKMKKVQDINIQHKVLPVFSDRTVTASQVASIPGKNKKKAERKEGTVRIIFVDSVSNSSVADVVMTSIAAQQLAHGIGHTLERLKKEIADPGMPAAKQAKAKPDQHTYIG